MYKDWSQIEKEKQERIDKAIKKKELHWNQQSLSILVSWSINCAIASLSEKDKKKKNWFQLIKKRYPKFIDEYRNWMVENMPLESPEKVKLTAQDFIEAQKEAPQSQALQEKADKMEEEAIREKDNLKQAELESELPIIRE